MFFFVFQRRGAGMDAPAQKWTWIRLPGSQSNPLAAPLKNKKERDVVSGRL